MKLESSANQPKMQQRIMLRLALGLFAVAALLLGWTFLKKFIQNNGDTGHTDTAGWIVALRQTGSGEQAVALKPDDTVLDSPDYPDGAIDRDVTWQPDGERIYFSSDREVGTKSLQISRWNPKGTVDQRSSGKLAQERPIFQEDGTITGDYKMLMIKAGVVVEFNPSDSVAHQLVPKVESSSPTKVAGEDPGGMGTQFGPEYEHLGGSFREAHWCKNRKYIAGIMRGDEGETLVVICLEPGPTPGPLSDGLPHGIVKGEHIDMAIDSRTGNVAYTVDDFRYVDTKNVPASMIKDGKLIKPFRNMIGFLNVEDFKGIVAVAASSDAEHAFAEPQVSPDGAQIAFIEGADTADGFKPQALYLTPFAVGQARSAKPLVGGALASPSWSPDGQQIAYVVLDPDGHSDIAVVPAAGGTPKILTAGKGSFSSPHFSPMLPKPGS